MQLVKDGRLAKWIGKATIFRSPIRLGQWRFRRRAVSRRRHKNRETVSPTSVPQFKRLSGLVGLIHSWDGVPLRLGALILR
jgi:hypothetical protein